jgi:hypothetical protein
MKNILTMTTILILSATTAWAGDFNGLWSGTGQLTDAFRRTSSCEEITYEFNHTPDVLTVVYGFIKCPPYREDVQPFSMAIHGKNLVYKGRTVGTVTDTAIHLEGLFNHVVDFVFDGDNLTYRDGQVDLVGNYIWKAEGSLIKQTH